MRGRDPALGQDRAQRSAKHGHRALDLALRYRVSAAPARRGAARARPGRRRPARGGRAQ